MPITRKLTSNFKPQVIPQMLLVLKRCNEDGPDVFRFSYFLCFSGTFGKEGVITTDTNWFEVILLP